MTLEGADRFSFGPALGELAVGVDADGEQMLLYVTNDFTFFSYGTDVQERDVRAEYVTGTWLVQAHRFLGEGSGSA